MKRFLKPVTVLLLFSTLVMYQFNNLRDLTIRLLDPIFGFENSMFIKNTVLREQYRKQNEKLKKCRCILIGDSHTYSIKEFIKPEDSIVNTGIKGETIRGVLRRFDDNIANINADIAVIQLGYNDFKYRSVEDALLNYKEILTKLDSRVVYIVSLFPVNPRRTIANKQIRQFNDSLKQICNTSSRYHFINFYETLYSEKSKGLDARFDTDGVHLTKEGYLLYIKSLLQIVKDSAAVQ